MKKYKYLPSYQIKEMPEMEKPISSMSYINPNDRGKHHYEVIIEYWRHIDSLKTFAVSKPVPEWLGREDLIENVDFRFSYQIKWHENFATEWKEVVSMRMYDEVYETSRRVIAVPIEQPKPTEETIIL